MPLTRIFSDSFQHVGCRSCEHRIKYAQVKIFGAPSKRLPERILQFFLRVTRMVHEGVVNKSLGLYDSVEIELIAGH